MSVRWLSISSASVVSLVATLLFAEVDSATAHPITIDPGHGDDPGNVGGPCAESHMNLNVASAFQRWVSTLPSGANFQPAFTRLTDIRLSPADRIAIGVAHNSEAFLSMHHDFVHPNVGCKGFVMYNPNNHSQSFWLATDLNDYGLEHFWGDYFITDNGIKQDLIVRPNPPAGIAVLRDNPKPAALGEGFGVDCTSNRVNLSVCCPTCFTDINAAADEALGYYFGIKKYFNVTSVGTSFAATGGAGQVTLTWTESDPGRHVSYDLYRADTCYGPYTFLGYVDSGDPAHTPDDEHYTFVDNSVQFARPYYYRLAVTVELVAATASPLSLPSSTVPGVPSNLSAQTGSQVSLTWNASTGSVTGYRVFRGMDYPITNCDSHLEMIGTTSSTSFQDTNAPHGVPLFYRVMAYNSTGTSAISSQASTAITTDSPQAGVEQSRESMQLEVLPNGRTFRFALARQGLITISIYDVRGRLVAVPFVGALGAGQHAKDWNGDWRGQRLSSGIYFVRLQSSAGPAATAKMLVLR